MWIMLKKLKCHVGNNLLKNHVNDFEKKIESILADN